MLPNSRSQHFSHFCPMLSSRHCRVSDFTWKSRTYFRLIFKWHMDVWKFFVCFLLVGIQLFSQHLLKRLFFLHYIAFALLSTIIHTCLGLFLDFIFCPLIDMPIFPPILHCLYSCNKSLNCVIRFLQCDFSFPKLFWYSGSLPFDINLWISLSIATKISAEFLIYIAVNLNIPLGRI